MTLAFERGFQNLFTNLGTSKTNADISQISGYFGAGFVIGGASHLIKVSSKYWDSPNGLSKGDVKALNYHINNVMEWGLQRFNGYVDEQSKSQNKDKYLWKTVIKNTFNIGVSNIVSPLGR